MKTDILFSIVIPTYNRADLIGETLESVFRQTYKNYEVIVVDNSSTDNTQSVLAPFAERGMIRYIQHDRNYERSRSRNTGMQQAIGDYLTFLDSDDFMYPDCLKDAAEYIKANPEIKFFHNLYELVSNEQQLIYSYYFPKLSNQFKALASGNFISCIGGFIHRDIYQIHRFNEDPKMVGSEDYEVWFEIAAKYKLGRINKVNSGIREHPNRSVNQGIYDNLEYQRLKLIDKIKEDNLLRAKFGRYNSRINTSFLLQEAIVLRKLNGRSSAIRKTIEAIISDISILSTKRLYSVVYNIIK